ncbi:MAG TPA: DUF4384 domain-containing protein, partial [Gemmatimonadales bacterium]|nr:DUF4384 domain-containing protein [Gemmatimonadales bacterium]
HPARPDTIVPEPAHPAHHIVSGGRIAVWTDRDEPYHRGEGARVYLELSQPAFVTVFRVDTDGRLRVIFPREPWSDPYVRDDRETIELPGNRGGRSFIVDDSPGVGYLFAIASSEPFDYDPIARGDYWDYRLIDGGRIQRDPYVVLTDLAERIAPDADYDYDVMPYYVERHYEYPRFVCYDCHAYASYDQWNPYSRSCARFDLVIYDDPRYYPYRSGRGRNVVITRPTHPGARFVFRDAEPGRDSVTREASGGRSEDTDRRRTGAENRSSLDVGGPGSVPTPGVQAPVGRQGERAPALAPRISEERRPAAPSDSERPTKDVSPPPDRAREPAPPTTRPSPSVQQTTKPRSTGEPELRRRKP